MELAEDCFVTIGICLKQSNSVDCKVGGNYKKIDVYCTELEPGNIFLSATSTILFQNRRPRTKLHRMGENLDL